MIDEEKNAETERERKKYFISFRKAILMHVSNKNILFIYNYIF